MWLRHCKWCMWLFRIALMCDDISLAKITTKPCFDNAKCRFYHELIPKAVKMKRTPTWKQHEGNESLSQCRANEAWRWILRMLRNRVSQGWRAHVVSQTSVELSYLSSGMWQHQTSKRFTIHVVLWAGRAGWTIISSQFHWSNPRLGEWRRGVWKWCQETLYRTVKTRTNNLNAFFVLKLTCNEFSCKRKLSQML